MKSNTIAFTVVALALSLAAAPSLSGQASCHEEPAQAGKAQVPAKGSPGVADRQAQPLQKAPAKPPQSGQAQPPQEAPAQASQKGQARPGLQARPLQQVPAQPGAAGQPQEAPGGQVAAGGPATPERGGRPGAGGPKAGAKAAVPPSVLLPNLPRPLDVGDYTWKWIPPEVRTVQEKVWIPGFQRAVLSGTELTTVVDPWGCVHEVCSPTYRWVTTPGRYETRDSFQIVKPGFWVPVLRGAE